MAEGINMLGWRQVMSRLEDDPVQRHIGMGGVGAGGRFPFPQPEENREAGRKRGTGQVNKYISIIERP